MLHRKTARWPIEKGPSSPALAAPRRVRGGAPLARASLIAAATALLACGASDASVRDPDPASCAGPYPCAPMASPPPLGGYPSQPQGAPYAAGAPAPSAPLAIVPSAAPSDPAPSPPSAASSSAPKTP